MSFYDQGTGAGVEIHSTFLFPAFAQSSDIFFFPEQSKRKKKKSVGKRYCSYCNRGCRCVGTGFKASFVGRRKTFFFFFFVTDGGRRYVGRYVLQIWYVGGVERQLARIWTHIFAKTYSQRTVSPESLIYSVALFLYSFIFLVYFRWKLCR